MPAPQNSFDRVECPLCEIQQTNYKLKSSLETTETSHSTGVVRRFFAEREVLRIFIADQALWSQSK